MPNKTKIQETLEKTIKIYIDSNIYLFKTDDDFNIQCGLKPRLIDMAVQDACIECRKVGLTRNFKNEDDYNKLFDLAMKFAVYYLSCK